MIGRTGIGRYEYAGGVVQRLCIGAYNALYGGTVGTLQIAGRARICRGLLVLVPVVLEAGLEVQIVLPYRIVAALIGRDGIARYGCLVAGVVGKYAFEGLRKAADVGTR